MYDEHNEQAQKESIAKKQAKKLLQNKAAALLKKGGKMVAKVAMKAAFAVTKSILGLLSAIGWPYVLILGGVLLSLFIIYLGTAMLFANDEDSLTPEGKELRRHIIAVADSTVDMSRPEQVPYRVPHELIMSALQIYDSTKHGKTEKEAATIMGKALAPIFTYKELEGHIETETTTCVDGSCSTSVTKTPFILNLLEHVEAWDRVMQATFTPFTTDWVTSTSSSTSYETREYIDEKGEVQYESYPVTTITTVKTRAHTFIPNEVVTEDYTYFDRVLSAPPFDYGQNDRFMVEAIYQATGGEIRYKEWLTGASMDGFNGTVTPGSSVPMEFMQYYLAAEKIYKVDWYFIAAIHFVETGFSTHPTMISSVGAEGHMQFMPCTWLGWSYPACKGTNGYAPIPESIKYNPLEVKKYGGYGIDADGNGKASPWDPKDAIFAAASYLNKNGFSKNIDQAIRAYNHADWYVRRVKEAAERFRNEASYTPDSGSIPPLQPGSFMRPAVGPKSSGFGYRSLGGGSFHAGVDISGQGQTNIPIVASADGVVSKVNTGCPPNGFYGNKCGGEFGNYVFIKHTVNGQTYETIYAHMRKVGVALNQPVKQGQFLGIMGTSGSSTGIHLHFEIHKGHKQGSKNVLNPELFISF